MQIVGGRAPERNNRHNIFVQRQIDSLRSLIPNMQVIYAGLGSKAEDMLALARKLQYAIKTFKPEVIHAQYATATGAVTIMNCGPIPIIVSFGGDEIYGTYINAHSTQSWRTSLALRCSRYCAKKAAVCIAKNERMREILKKWGAGRVEVIPNGVNLDLFKALDQPFCRAQLGLKRDAQYVVFAVRDNDYVKRRDLAEKAVELCRLDSSHQIELLILDHVAPAMIPLYLNAGNVLLLCSNHEGSPNIVKEALACNRPVVSTDVGDIRERFSYVNGLFLVRQNPIDIAQGLKQALLCKESNGRDSVMTLSEEIVAQRLFHLYQSLRMKLLGSVLPY